MLPLLHCAVKVWCEVVCSGVCSVVQSDMWCDV